MLYEHTNSEGGELKGEADGSEEEVLLLKQEVKKLLSASHLSEGEEAMELLYNGEGIVEYLPCTQ